MLFVAKCALYSLKAGGRGEGKKRNNTKLQVPFASSGFSLLLFPFLHDLLPAWKGEEEEGKLVSAINPFLVPEAGRLWLQSTQTHLLWLPRTGKRKNWVINWRHNGYEKQIQRQEVKKTIFNEGEGDFVCSESQDFSFFPLIIFSSLAQSVRSPIAFSLGQDPPCSISGKDQRGKSFRSTIPCCYENHQLVAQSWEGIYGGGGGWNLF